MAFGWKRQGKVRTDAAVEFVGGFLFLLLFEGGRSRYLIQFYHSFYYWQALRWVIVYVLLSEFLHWIKRIKGINNEL